MVRHKNSKAKWGRVSVLFIAMSLAAALFSGSVRATDLEMGPWIQKLKISGDYRLRQENFFNKNDPNGQFANSGGRSRQRFRLRLALDLPYDDLGLTAKVRLASGTGEQVSTNQSLDNLSSQKSFWIDRAYLEWKQFPWVTLTGGRMANPLWTVYSSDALWDDDFNPEGFGQNLTYLVGPARVFLNGLQMVVDEDNGNKGDQWEISGQLGAEFKLPLESRLQIAGALHEWVNETTTTRKNAGTLSQVVSQDGNRRYASGVLKNEFRVAEVTGQFSFWLRTLPVVLQGTYLKNTAALDQFSVPKKEDKGYQFGGIVGKAAAKNSWEAAYFYKYLESDATVADVADSDFGNGGTGRKGHIFWLAYSPRDWMQAKIKYFATKLITNNSNAITISSLGTRNYDINRLQADLAVKF